LRVKNTVKYVQVKCKRCGDIVNIPIDDEILSRAEKSPSGLTGVSVIHGDHIVLAYVDSHGNIRSIEVVDAVKRTISYTRMKRIPIPKDKTEGLPSLDLLSPIEWRILAFCDGKRSIGEIADLVGMHYFDVKLILEKLYQKGYIKEIRTVLS